MDEEFYEKELQLERTIHALIRICDGEVRSQQNGQAAIAYR